MVNFSISSTRYAAWRVGLALLCSMTPSAWGEEMPTPQEMEALFKEAEEVRRSMRQKLETLDPATRKKYEEILAAAEAEEDEGDSQIPERNTARLAELSSKPLSGADLKTHVQQLQPKILAALSPSARQRVGRIDAELAKRADYLLSLRAAANGLAIWGAWPEATALMGKAALAGGDAEDLNNLAAFLTMQRAEAAALPILQTLDSRYPNNSTLLNNLAQARFGLGDIETAERLLIAALRIKPAHPQANVTLARIKQSRSDPLGAEQALLKAVEGGYSESKEQALRKLGHELQRDELRWRIPMPQDPLGLEKFFPPAYPKDATELPLAVPEWDAFRADVQALHDALRQALEAVKLKSAAARAQPAAPAGLLRSAVSGPFQAIVQRMSQFDGEVLRNWERKVQQGRSEAGSAYSTEKMKLDRRLVEIDKEGDRKYHSIPGGYQRDYTCPQTLEAINAFLATNRALEAAQRDYLDFQRKRINDRVYLAQFTSTPEHFEFVKAAAKVEFINSLVSLRVALFDPVHGGRPGCFQAGKASTRKPVKLPDFDEIHCQDISSFTMPSVGRIDIRCNRMTSSFEPVFAPLKASWEEDLNSGRLLSASVEFTVEAVTVGAQGAFDDGRLRSGGITVGVEVGEVEVGGVKVGGVNVGAHSEFDDKGLKSGGIHVGAKQDIGPNLTAGPLEMGTGVAVSAGLEIDRNGISDVEASAGISSEASSTLGKTDAAESKGTLNAGVTSRWSWNSGFNAGVSGSFDNSVF